MITVLNGEMIIFRGILSQFKEMIHDLKIPFDNNVGVYGVCESTCRCAHVTHSITRITVAIEKYGFRVDVSYYDAVTVIFIFGRGGLGGVFLEFC